MTAYRRGADFERRVKARLEEDGWTVFRTAGSHSPCDLIAFRPVEDGFQVDGYQVDVRFVQCKSGVTKMTKRERQDFREFAERLCAEPVVWLRGMKEEAA